MLDEIVKLSNELRDAANDVDTAEDLLKKAKERLDSAKNALRSVCLNNDIKNFKQVLYPFDGETYIIRHADNARALFAEKIEYYKPSEPQTNS